MKVELIHHTPLWVASKAIRKCWASEDKSDTIYNTTWADSTSINNIDMQTADKECIICGTKDRALIERIGNQNKHKSTLEHLVYNFNIDGISRACLQELARHRMASYSVKSTRYTLKELKDEDTFIKPISNLGFEYDIERSKQYLVLPPHAIKYDKVWQKQVKALEELRDELVYGKDSNDVIKYMLPEAYKTSLVMTINARSLQNFLELRSSKHALWEIRNLARAMFNALPEDHKYLFEYCMQDKESV